MDGLLWSLEKKRIQFLEVGKWIMKLFTTKNWKARHKCPSCNYIFCTMKTNSHQTEIKVNTQKWVFHLSLLQLNESEITLIYKYNGPPPYDLRVGSWVGLIQKRVIIKANLAASSISSFFFILFVIKQIPKQRCMDPQMIPSLFSHTNFNASEADYYLYCTKCFTCCPYPLWNLCCCGGRGKSTHIISVLF